MAALCFMLVAWSAESTVIKLGGFSIAASATCGTCQSASFLLALVI